MSLESELTFLAEAKQKKIKKAVWGDYVLYDRIYLAENLDQECELIKKWYEHKKKIESGEIPYPKMKLDELRREINNE